jgi:phosphohistidine phosphatase
MKLYIVQHGLATSKLENPLRPLTGQGVYDVQRLGVELARRGIAPGHIFHSGKQRAMQTAQLIASSIGRPDCIEQIDGIAPNDDVTAFALYIKTFADDVLIASHLPFVHNLCAALIGKSGLGEFEFSPGRAVCIDNDGHRPTLCWTV